MKKTDTGKLKMMLRKDAVRLVVVLLAAFLMAMNINSFVNAGGLYPGGATGIAIIIQRIALKYWGVSIPYTPACVSLSL